MYENEEKRMKEKVINGIVYYTYWGGKEVCVMWKDVKKNDGTMLLCRRKQIRGRLYIIRNDRMFVSCIDVLLLLPRLHFIGLENSQKD